MKIALCISGETRHYNKYFGPEVFITWLMSHGHSVDVFGHTWTHCDVPSSSDIIRFKELLIEDQDTVISNWVLENPEKRGWPGDFKDQAEMLNKTKAKCGQHVGGIKSLQMPNTEDYDVFIRWRWDLTINNDVLNGKMYMLDDLWLPKLEFTRTRSEPVGITSCLSWLTAEYPSIEDTHYIFNKSAHKNLKQIDTLGAIEGIWNDGPDADFVSYHILWNYLLIRFGNIMLGTLLPDVFVFEDGWDQSKKDDIYK